MKNRINQTTLREVDLAHKQGAMVMSLLKQLTEAAETLCLTKPCNYKCQCDASKKNREAQTELRIVVGKVNNFLYHLERKE